MINDTEDKVCTTVDEVKKNCLTSKIEKKNILNKCTQANNYTKKN